MSQPSDANGPAPITNSEYNFVPYPSHSSPQHSMSDYARIMLEHTRRQLDTATDSARRRSQDGDMQSQRSSNQSPNSLSSVRSTDS